MKLFTRLPHPSWGYEETLKRITQIPEPRIRRFCAISYATGGRINEVTQIKPENINITGRNNELVIVKIPTLKRKKEIYREIILEKEHEKIYCGALTKFADEAEAQGMPNLGAWCGFGIRKLRYDIVKNLGCINHSLRHLRATHIGKGKVPGRMHTPTPSYLLKYFGWTKISMASYYIDYLTTEDVLEKYYMGTSSSPADLEDFGIDTADTTPSTLDGGEGGAGP